MPASKIADLLRQLQKKPSLSLEEYELILSNRTKEDEELAKNLAKECTEAILWQWGVYQRINRVHQLLQERLSLLRDSEGKSRGGALSPDEGGNLGLVAGKGINWAFVPLFYREGKILTLRMSEL